MHPKARHSKQTVTVTGPPSDETNLVWAEAGIQDSLETFLTSLANVDTILLGRATYDDLVRRWPKVREWPHVSDVTLRIGDKINATPKVVVTGRHPLESLEWGELEPPTQLTGRLDREACVGQECRERPGVEEAHAGAVHAQRRAAPFACRLGERDHVAHDRFHLVRTRTDRPHGSMTPVEFRGSQPSHARASGFRVSNAKRPPRESARRIAASEARSSSSPTSSWKAWPAMTARSNSPSQAIAAAVHLTHSMSARRRASSSIARSGSTPHNRPECPASRARRSSVPVPQPTSSADGASIAKAR
jgi:hypothetical protein